MDEWEGYQVVHREFFAQTNAPALTFYKHQCYVNPACLRCFPQAEYVQILIDAERSLLAIRPSTEQTPDTIPWFRVRDGMPMPKKITCRVLCAKVFERFGWQYGGRYRLLGKAMGTQEDGLIVFDLMAPQAYLSGNATPQLPQTWREQFGLPVEIQKTRLHVALVDEYVVYGMKEGENHEPINSPDDR